MKNTPKGWPRLSSAIYYQDAAAAIDWLQAAFGFDVRLKVEGDKGRIEHSELTFGEAVVMVAQEQAGSTRTEVHSRMRSPRTLGGMGTQALMLYVDDADAPCVRARAAGAAIFMEPAVHDYGAEYWADRSYGAFDVEGHAWWFTQRVRDPQS